jgi:hypothetical protein
LRLNKQIDQSKYQSYDNPDDETFNGDFLFIIKILVVRSPRSEGSNEVANNQSTKDEIAGDENGFDESKILRRKKDIASEVDNPDNEGQKKEKSS